MRLNAKQLRDADPEELKVKIREIKRRPLYFILENIYDTYNIGGLFRLADALNAEKIFLCGQSETPPNHKIKKASIGTDKIVPWEYKKSAAEAVEQLRQETGQKITIYAVEQLPESSDYTKPNYKLPLALIFGNETFGVTPETLKLADKAVVIPMYGINKSLNVIVAAAIVSYWIDNHLGDKNY
ncbi:MAG: TrmH family RNA methyltransferase [Patescibacteria group bacterium]|mgnify:CR=1 FL=1